MNCYRKKEFLKEIQKEIKSEFTGRDQKDIELQGEIKALKNGLLSIQGRTFKASCKKLLEEGHEITPGDIVSIGDIKLRVEAY